MPVDRAGAGLVCEVYPAASRVAWGLPAKVRDLDGLLQQLPLAVPPAHQAQLASEHVFDALIAALTARAVAQCATDQIPTEDQDLAAEEGWIHLPSRGGALTGLAGR